MDYQTTTTSGVAEHYVRTYEATVDDESRAFQLDIAPSSFPDSNILGDRFQFFTVESMTVYANPVGNPIHRSSCLILGVNPDSSNVLLDSDVEVFSSNILRLKSSKLLEKDGVGQISICDSFRKNYYCKPAGLRRLEVPLVLNATLVNETPVDERLSPWVIYINVHFKFYNPTFTLSQSSPVNFNINFVNASDVTSTSAFVDVVLPGQAALVVSGAVTLQFDHNVTFTVDYTINADGNVNTSLATVKENTLDVLILRFLGTNISDSPIDSDPTLTSIHQNGVIQAISN